MERSERGRSKSIEQIEKSQIQRKRKEVKVWMFADGDAVQNEEQNVLAAELSRPRC